ncbi:MAG TPA: O-antigen ligase family protein, partial [Verrucomicrobiae bacterium]|nr:O-antigen ligase family protein [Verrucomicrobiae bacterium]
LGLWQETWGKGAGTFANPNHFADWLYVGSLFCLGWALRRIWPLQSARNKPAHRPRNYLDGGFLIVAAVVGVVMALASGSRGGFASFVAGGLAWIALVIRRSEGEKRKVIVGVAALAAVVLVLGAGSVLINRLAKSRADNASRYSKGEIWRQSWSIFQKYPVFGTGWGSFVYAYNHYKQSGGDSTIWHAENDYLQQLVETGLLGTVLLGGLLAYLLRAPLASAWREKSDEPEVLLGALAGLVVFATHALIEFVFQITATATLAAALLGFATGATWRGKLSVVAEPMTYRRLALNLALALALLAGATFQAAAFWSWRMAIAQMRSAPRHATRRIEESLRYWPWASNRRIGLARSQTRLLDADNTRKPEQWKPIRAGLTRALAQDPANWEVRLERLLLDLDYSRDPRLARDETREMLELCPLQPRLPLLLAQRVAGQNPALAGELLRKEIPADAKDLRAALELAWKLERSAPLLWNLTPDTAGGLNILATFALQEKLEPLALQAFLRLTNHMDNLGVARLVLQEARRPDMAIGLIPEKTATLEGKLLLARAYSQTRAFERVLPLVGEVIRTVEGNRDVLAPVAPRLDLEAARQAAQAAPLDEGRAVTLAEAWMDQAPFRRDLPALRQLAAKFPGSARINWLVARAFSEVGDDETAGNMALGVANQIMVGRR